MCNNSYTFQSCLFLGEAQFRCFSADQSAGVRQNLPRKWKLERARCRKPVTVVYTLHNTPLFGLAFYTLTSADIFSIQFFILLLRR